MDVHKDLPAQAGRDAPAGLPSLLRVAGMKLAALFALYVVSAVVAFVAYPRHVLPYGLASWCGGVLLVLLVQEFARLWQNRP